MITAEEEATFRRIVREEMTLQAACKNAAESMRIPNNVHVSATPDDIFSIKYLLPVLRDIEAARVRSILKQECAEQAFEWQKLLVEEIREVREAVRQQIKSAHIKLSADEILEIVRQVMRATRTDDPVAK